MIARAKMFIVAENIDDSIKSQTSSYDITIFKSFIDFEKYANEVPIIIDTLVISAGTLPFNGVNMMRVVTLLESPFLNITGNVIYLIDGSVRYEAVNDFLEMKGITNWAVYQGDLSIRFITDIVTGVGRQQAEGQNEIITYRVRATEYIKQQNQLKYESDSKKYYTDEDILGDIPDEEEPNDIQPAQENEVIINYVVGPDDIDRTLMVFLLAQYRSMQGKTLIMEKDSEFHMLTELVTKAGLEHEYIDISDVMSDVDDVLKRIRSCVSTLVVIGSKRRVGYDYNFIMDLLQHNLHSEIPFIIRECSFKEIPYGYNFTVVMRNMVPAVLKYCNEIQEKINPEKVTFIGVQSCNYGTLNLTSKEMKAVIESVLGINGVTVQVVHINGIVLRGEEVVYDVFSILNRGNER